MINAREVAEQFIKHFKQIKVYNQVCNLCGHAQGHPLTYCPVCPGKMKIIMYSELRHFMKLENPAHNFWYKYRCAGLIHKDHLSTVEWQAIIHEIRELDDGI